MQRSLLKKADIEDILNHALKLIPDHLQHSFYLNLYMKKDNFAVTQNNMYFIMLNEILQCPNSFYLLKNIISKRVAIPPYLNEIFSSTTGNPLRLFHVTSLLTDQPIYDPSNYAKLPVDVTPKIPFDIGVQVGKFLDDEELKEFSTFTKHAHSFFAGALVQRARSKLFEYAYFNKQDKIQQILNRYPVFRNDEQLMLNLYLHHIAFGQPHEAIKLLQQYPLENKFGTVVTYSGDTIENVTGMQLAYVLEDEEAAMMIWNCLDAKSKLIANQHLANKIEEIDAQESRFVDYDYTNFIKAINNNQRLYTRASANAETQQELVKLKAYFQPGIVNKGRPFNMRHLCKAYLICSNLNGNATSWFNSYVINYHLLDRVSTWYGQAFSNGLKNIFKKNQILPFKRHLDVKFVAGLAFKRVIFKKLYYSGLNQSSHQSRIEYNILSGEILVGNYGKITTIITKAAAAIENLCEIKRMAMEDFKQFIKKDLSEINRKSCRF